MSKIEILPAFGISGGGSTMHAIILCGIRPKLVVASDHGAGGIQKALHAGIPRSDIAIISPKDYPGDPIAFGEAILVECRKRGVNFFGQYGWLPMTPLNVIQAFKGMIVNQHPGPLDPCHGSNDFGGKGMYGTRVHCARLLYVRTTNHDHWTEVVAHRVTEEFDKGAVLHSRKVDILPTDTPLTLQERCLPIEHQVQIETLGMFMKGTVNEIVRPEPLVMPWELPQLAQAKMVACKLFPKG